GSTKPVFARSRSVMLTFTSRGLREASLWLSGPTLPSALKSPPPGRFAVRVTGNWDFNETLVASRCTLSKTLFLSEAVDPTVTRPFSSLSSATVKSGVALAPDLLAVGGPGEDA